MGRNSLFLCVISTVGLSLHAGDTAKRTWADVVRGEKNETQITSVVKTRKFHYQPHPRCGVCERLLKEHDDSYCERVILADLLAQLYANAGIEPGRAHIKIKS